MGALVMLAALLIGAVALMLQGDFETGGIGLLFVGTFLFVASQPFARMEREDRRRARIVATALVLAAWFLAGALAWDWEAGSYAIAGVVALIALGRAAAVPPVIADEPTAERSA